MWSSTLYTLLALSIPKYNAQGVLGALIAPKPFGALTPNSLPVRRIRLRIGTVIVLLRNINLNEDNATGHDLL